MRWVDLQSFGSFNYRAYHGFGQAKFHDSGSVSGSSQFSILTELPPKILLDSKVVKINPKKSSRFVNLNPLHTQLCRCF